MSENKLRVGWLQVISVWRWHSDDVSAPDRVWWLFCCSSDSGVSLLVALVTLWWVWRLFPLFLFWLQWSYQVNWWWWYFWWYFGVSGDRASAAFGWHTARPPKTPQHTFRLLSSWQWSCSFHHPLLCCSSYWFRVHSLVFVDGHWQYSNILKVVRGCVIVC